MILDWEKGFFWKQKIFRTTWGLFFLFILQCPKLANAKWEANMMKMFLPKICKIHRYIGTPQDVNIYKYTYIYIVYNDINALLAQNFVAGRARTKHWWLSDYRPLPLLGDAEWDGQGWFLDQELELLTWVACLNKHPEQLKHGICSEFDAFLWKQNNSIYLLIIIVFTVNLFVYWMNANITGRQLRWELASHCWLPSLCCWPPPAIGGLPHWVSSVTWKHWKKTEVLKTWFPWKWTIFLQKRDHLKRRGLIFLNHWNFHDIRSFWGEHCPETKSFEACRWPDDYKKAGVLLN